MSFFFDRSLQKDGLGHVFYVRALHACRERAVTAAGTANALRYRICRVLCMRTA